MNRFGKSNALFPHIRLYINLGTRDAVTDVVKRQDLTNEVTVTAGRLTWAGDKCPKIQHLFSFAEKMVC